MSEKTLDGQLEELLAELPPCAITVEKSEWAYTRIKAFWPLMLSGIAMSIMGYSGGGLYSYLLMLKVVGGVFTALAAAEAVGDLVHHHLMLRKPVLANHEFIINKDRPGQIVEKVGTHWIETNITELMGKGITLESLFAALEKPLQTQSDALQLVQDTRERVLAHAELTEALRPARGRKALPGKEEAT